MYLPSLPMAKAILLLSCFFLRLAILAADLLQNPDFESPPTNLTANTTDRFLLRPGINSIPGWSFSGTVWYISSSSNLSLPGNGHGVQLGQNGKINQTFRHDKNYYEYVLTFTLAPGHKDCPNNVTAVNISSPGRSKVYFFEGRYGKEMWESHAHYLRLSDDKDLNLEIQSVQMAADPDSICRPVVDTLLIKRIGSPIAYDDNHLANSGFEVGPAFLKNSTEGILLDEEPDLFLSALQQWSLIGTIKYIDSKHYHVPEGRAAVELISGGILTTPLLTMGTEYTLEFTLGDAKDSCFGNLTIWAQAGQTIQNFTALSNGNGSSKKYSMTFNAISRLTPISLVGFNESQRSDGVLCGPVVDDVLLRYSSAIRKTWGIWILFFSAISSIQMIV